jgi:hypothetical protein
MELSGTSVQSLYQQYGVATGAGRAHHRSVTVETAQVETVDEDRAGAMFAIGVVR